MSVRPAKTQIRSESSLCARWEAKDSMFLQADSEDCEDWLDWADAQADLCLHKAHMPFCWLCHEAAHVYQ